MLHPPRRQRIGKDRAGRGLDIVLAHQRFTDQEGARAVFRHFGQILRRGQPAFANDHPAFGHKLGQAARGVERGLEGVEIAVVDADHHGFEMCRAVQFGAVMHLDQSVHAPVFCRGLKLGGLGVTDRRHNDQDAVRTPGARLGDLIGVIHEILAQHRQIAGGARLPKILGRALKAGCIGQHRQAGRATGRIGPRQLGRVELGADQPLGRASLLDFGNQPIALFRGLQQRSGEGAHGAGLFRGGLDLVERSGGLGLGDFVELVGLDLFENGWGRHVASDVTLARASILPRAAPQSMLSAACATPSWGSPAWPATTRAAAALSSTASRYAPRWPSSSARKAAALCSGVPPRMVSNGCTGRPNASGCSSVSVTAPVSSSWATQVMPEIDISSVPSLPCTSHARSDPSCPRVSDIGRMRSRENAPVNCRFTPAGLVSGPRMLKIVLVPNSARTGPTWAMAGWCIGAIMKAIPTSRRARSTVSTPTITLMPICVSASAAPDLELRLRLPCLATGTPAPATTKAVAVEMLSVPLPSPPVPTMSIAPAGAVTLLHLARITAAAAAYSTTVSPRVRSAIRNPPICAGVASPSNRQVNASSASARVRARSAAVPISGLRRSLMPAPSSDQGNSSAAHAHAARQSIRGGTARRGSASRGAAGP